MIPRLSNELRWGRRLGRQAYRERNRVERTLNRLQQFRRVATGDEKGADNYLALLTLAAIVFWL
jgi:transposase